MINKQKPEIIIVDEHLEAYLSIEDAFESQLFDSPIKLIHVDFHSDMLSPLTQMSCYDQDHRRYVEKHLSIGSFIVPLIVRKRVSSVIHLNHRVNLPAKKQFAGSLHGKGRILCNDVGKSVRSHFPDITPWNFRQTTDVKSVLRSVRSSHYALSIDCDYFSSNQWPIVPFDFRFTQSQRTRINGFKTSDDKYRIALPVFPDDHGRRMFAGMAFNSEREWIDLLIDYFALHLRVEPELVIICKSSKSGYTPIRHCDHIVSSLLERLSMPPNRISLPDGAVIETTDHAVFESNSLINVNQMQILRLNKFQSCVMKLAAKGETIVDTAKYMLRRYNISEKSFTYDLLRFLFCMKALYLLK